MYGNEQAILAQARRDVLVVWLHENNQGPLSQKSSASMTRIHLASHARRTRPAGPALGWAE